MMINIGNASVVVADLIRMIMLFLHDDHVPKYIYVDAYLDAP